ncbi:MBL fold metallo-hydrolase [Paenibacillus sp. 1011MAR3C5]|uniref:MBL fold metallo-hydrolase n=1 Tax=Paenibacillus sp. 1011MAR3C5 TaxID=1675787 RepID=UPI000E6D4343|nr:MBL fold metallo-hydrolase [Paenibacillus sp. 1011MAR3C5]RJE88891.1 MBL fold metallo-hydrolase [Paenibacillus sp. 1011MAR3C5]
MRKIRQQTVVQLTYLPNLFPVNCYLVEEEDSLTLVDAALPANAPAIRKAAEEMGKPITRIVLTHAHGDHVGSLDALKKQLPDVRVYISDRDARLLRGDSTLLDGEEQLPIRGDVPKKIETLPDVRLQDGDRIGSLLALSTPGHTPGSMSFYDERTGVLIAGDAFAARGGLAVAGHMKLSFPFPALATWSPLASLESARKLADTHPAWLAVGHGNMIAKPEQAMRKAIAECEQRLFKKGVIKHVT